MTGPVVVGIDPGGRSTGVVIRSGAVLIDAVVIRRPTSSPITDLAAGLDAWRAQVIADLDGIVLAAGLRSAGPGPDRVPVVAAVNALAVGTLLIAVEGLVAPSPHHRRADGNSLTDPTGIIATAVIVGAIWQEWAGHVVDVPPGGNGSGPVDAYPSAIRPKPGGKGHDLNRHARSAWDVAGRATYAAAIARADQTRAASLRRVTHRLLT